MNKTLSEKYLPDLDYFRKNPQAKQYQVLTLDLTIARTDEKREFIANFLCVNVLPTESGKATKVRINHSENDLITLKEDKVIQGTIHSIFITNSAYSSGSIELIFGINFKVSK